MASGKATVMMEMETVRTEMVMGSEMVMVQTEMAMESEMVMELEKESCIQHCNSNYENLD